LAYGLPQIVKLECKDFEEGRHWLQPDVMDVMNKDPSAVQVLPVANDNQVVFTAKIISIPLFLVPLFLANNTPKKALPMFHHFYDTFYEICAPSMKLQTQYIYDFLLAACGTEEAPKGH